MPKHKVPKNKVPKPKVLILIRYSALGDVLLCLPILNQLAHSYPDYRIYFVTKARYAEAFAVLPANIQVLGMGSLSIWLQARKLFRLTRGQARVVDLHASLRSRILCLFLWLHGIILKARIRKFRQLRRKFLLSKGQQSLPSVWSIYSAALYKAGLPIPELDLEKWQYKQAFIQNCRGWQAMPKFWQTYAKQPFLVIAPFASHASKIYPTAHMRIILQHCLSAQLSVLLIGKGSAEESQIQHYLKEFASDHLYSTLLQPLSLAQELFLIAHAQAALVMDSGNMHLCALAGIPIVSIWGATSPQAGFNPWPQNHPLHSNLHCWPCSIYGEKPCSHPTETLACLKSLNPEQVWQEIKNILPKV